MSARCEAAARVAAGAPMSLFERWLTLWVFLCIVAGIVLGVLIKVPVMLLVVKVVNATRGWYERRA